MKATATAATNDDDDHGTENNHHQDYQNINDNNDDDDKILVDHERLQVVHLKRCIDSTQDETKRLLYNRHNSKLRDQQPCLDDSSSLSSFAVIADQQSNGRGTSGRKWVSTSAPAGTAAPATSSSTTNNNSISRGGGGDGHNLFFTYAIPMELIPMSQVMLLPIAMGLVVAETIAQYIQVKTNSNTDDDTTRITVKWPNDVLINDRKLAGILIENARITMTNNDGDDNNTTNTSSSSSYLSHDYWLVGIGINVVSHPTDLRNEGEGNVQSKLVVPSPLPPRQATSLIEYSNNNNNNDIQTVPSAVEIGTDLAHRIEELIRTEWNTTNNTHSNNNDPHNNNNNKLRLIDRWKQWAQFGMKQTIRDTGEEVTTVNIMDDGRLIVIDDQGHQRILVSDYFV